MKKEGLRTFTSEETLDLGWKTQGNEVWSERERFWEEKRPNLLRETGEK